MIQLHKLITQYPSILFGYTTYTGLRKIKNFRGFTPKVCVIVGFERDVTFIEQCPLRSAPGSTSYCRVVYYRKHIFRRLLSICEDAEKRLPMVIFAPYEECRVFEQFLLALKCYLILDFHRGIYEKYRNEYYWNLFYRSFCHKYSLLSRKNARLHEIYLPTLSVEYTDLSAEEVYRTNSDWDLCVMVGSKAPLRRSSSYSSYVFFKWMSTAKVLRICHALENGQRVLIIASLRADCSRSLANRLIMALRCHLIPDYVREFFGPFDLWNYWYDDFAARYSYGKSDLPATYRIEDVTIVE